MKVSCTHENLLTTLSYLEWVVGKQSHLPILSNILFEAEQGKLRLSATNLEIGVVSFFGAKVEEEGEVVVSAKLLLHFIQNLDPDKVIVMYTKGNQLIIENDRDEMYMNTVESKDFPIIPEYTGVYPVSVDGEMLDEALKRVVFAVSTNESRIELMGVYLSSSPRGIHLAATDSFRLAEYTLKNISTKEKETVDQFLQVHGGGIILPVDTLQELGRILQKNTDPVGLMLEENQIFFALGSTRVVSRVIQGRYPEYQQILPKEFRLEIQVSKAEFIRALKMATSFSQYGSGEVKCVFSHEQAMVEVITISPGVGEQKARLPFQGEVIEDLELLFQARHILEGVNSLTGDTVTLHINTKEAPVLMTGDEPNAHFYLVMPIRK